MLVDRAERFDRRLTGKDFLAISTQSFAQALGPKLAEPIGHAEESIGVRHHDQDGFAPLGISQKCDGAEERRRIFEDVGCFTALSHGRRAVEKLSLIHI